MTLTAPPIETNVPSTSPHTTWGSAPTEIANGRAGDLNTAPRPSENSTRGPNHLSSSSPTPSSLTCDTDVPHLRVSSELSSELVEYSDSARTNGVKSWRKGSQGKDNRAERGRTLQRTTSSPNPLAKAESRSRKHDLSIEVDTRSILKRPRRSSTFHDDPDSASALLDDSLLEPCPEPEPCSTVSEVLSSAPVSRSNTVNVKRADAKSSRSTTDTTYACTETDTPSSRRTVCNDRSPLHPTPNFPDQLPRLLPDITQLEYMATKASANEWSRVSSRTSSWACSLNLCSLASALPMEIIQQIYCNLSPADFDSARHTCRSWFTASLERRLLESMLKRGGWFAGCQYGLATNKINEARASFNDEWLMSKRIARENALGPGWKGNGMINENDSTQEFAFVYSATVDFTGISNHYLGSDTPAGTIFTVSSCGKLLMVSHGCLVYIYELNRNFDSKDGIFQTDSGSLRPVTSIICPARVLACSMDTSSHRYAIAILLDGRMGLVCDISLDKFVPQLQTADSANGSLPTSSSLSKESIASKGKGKDHATSAFLDHISLHSSNTDQSSSQSATGPPFVFPGAATTGAQSTSTGEEDTGRSTFKGYDRWSHRPGSSSRSPMSSRNPLITPDGCLRSVLLHMEGRDAEHKLLPIESGPRSIYGNLCSEDDPPRSVAICPQRRCVAFGCSAGIELHWVDALTGKDLNRWFPLTAPSDFLYFLPPRQSIDSAKKLRLISSTSRPGERAAAIERAFGSRIRSSPFWEDLGWGFAPEHAYYEGSDSASTRVKSDTPRPKNNLNTSDHFHAIPLSDGFHIIFTDPATGMLCLGSDAPVGGPTKLLRKIWFQAPRGKGKPIAYTAGCDLTWGVRVVAAYGTGEEQTIWLYSVPVDVFASERSAHYSLLIGHVQEQTRAEWMDWWPKDGWREWLNEMHDPTPGILPQRVWPLRIKGQEIGRCRGVVDLSIDAGPIMTIWAFSKVGKANIWRMKNGKDVVVKETVVARDGTLRKIDMDGDLEMIDTHPATPDIVRPSLLWSHYDGAHTSNDSAGTFNRVARCDRASGSMSEVAQDPDGDVVMDDEAQRESAKQSNDRFWAKFGWSEASFRGQIATVREDVVEDVAGIARIDIEIR